MSAEAPSVPPMALAGGEIARIWSKHLTSLLLPVNALLFLFSGPHPWYVAPIFMLPVVFAYVLDSNFRVERRQPVETLPAWPFDALVYLLAALQLAVLFGIAHLFALQDVFSVDMVVLVTAVGGSSGFAIITAHELIHRRKPWERVLGRLLLCTVLQEHFFTEHLRGHHVRVGRPDDPATARFGESYRDFYRRTVSAQFRSAWQIERRRLAQAGESRLWRNRVLQGLVVGWGMAFCVGWAAGLAGFVAFLLQAFFASRLLEAVNYFEHWGLERSGVRVGPRDSWDTHAWFTYYGLTGLSRHADHHCEPTRPYQQLRVREQVPMLPTGYVGMVDLVMARNDEFQRIAREELQRTGLGPFAQNAEPPAEPGPAEPPKRQIAGWRALPNWLRAGLTAGMVVLAATAGSRLIGDSVTPQSFVGQALVNAWILVAFLGMFRVENRLEAAGSGPPAAWSLALAFLLALGLASERVLSLLV